jgi:IclR family transcriptional regulator, acetate operon repressor
MKPTKKTASKVDPTSARLREDGAAVTGSLSRGLQVLEVLRHANGYLSLSDIAAETGLDASTVHRLLQALTENGYAARDDVQKRYLPGPRALSPLSLFHPVTLLRREAGAVLQAFQEETGETIALVLFIAQERLVVEFARGNQPLSPYYDTWLKSPLHGSGSGKLLLAWLSDAERKQLLGPGPYTAHTPQTITDPETLSQHLDQVRRQGYAVARDDAYQGLTAIGVPLMYPTDAQPLGCLVITSRSGSVSEQAEAEFADKLKTASRLLVNSAPSIQALKQWSVRGVARRSPPNLAIA